jgi:hypothetical protein
MKKTVTLSYRIEDSFDEHEVECARRGVALNIAIWNALQSIRTRLKYNDENVTDEERSFLEELRSDLGHAYIEEEGI